MQEMQQEWVPVHKHWRLNERNYGALVGMNKKACVEKHGAEVTTIFIPIYVSFSVCIHSSVTLSAVLHYFLTFLFFIL